jgi:hypothetical protein
MMKTAATAPLLLDRFTHMNRRKAYPNRVKPFNFLLSASVDPIDYPPRNRDMRGFQLVSPYSLNSLDWLRFSWIDVYAGKQYRIRTREPSTPTAIRVRDFEEVLRRFRDPPEAKSADSSANPANARTVELLGRRSVRVLTVRLIGKETNLLEQQEDGVLITDPLAVYPSNVEGELLRRRLGEVSIPELAERSGVSERMLRSVRDGSRRPSPATVEAVLRALEEMLGS